MTYNTEFDYITIKFTDKNSRPLEVKDKVNSTLLIFEQNWCVILQNQKQVNMLEDMDFCHLENIYLVNTENSYQVMLKKQE